MSRTNAAQKVVRDAGIVRDRARGYTWPSIAQRHQVTERHARRVFQQYLDLQHAEHELADMANVVTETIARFDATIEDLAALADSTTHDGVRLAAIRTRLAAINDRLDFLERVGLIPANTRAWRHEVEVPEATRKILGIFEKYGLGEEAEDDLLEAFGSAPRRSPVADIHRPA